MLVMNNGVVGSSRIVIEVAPRVVDSVVFVIVEVSIWKC